LGAIADIRRSWPWGAGPLLVPPTSPALVGAVPLALAATAIVFGRRPRAVVMWTLIGVALALTVVGFEGWARFGNDFVRAWPRPRMLVAGVCLAVAILSGFGIETVVALAAERAARLRATLFGLSFAIAAITLAVAIYFVKFAGAELSEELLLHCTRMLVGAAMVCAAALVVRSHELPQWRSRGWPWVALACFELLAFALPATRGVPIRELGAAGDVATFLRSRRDPARFIEAGAGGLPASFGTWQALEDAGGAGRSTPRHELWSSAVAAAGGRNGSDVLRVGNVRYLVTDKDASPLPPPWRKAHRSGSLTIYEDAEPLPRAWLAREGRRVDSPAKALEPLASTQPVNPREMALLDVDIDPADRSSIAARTDYWSPPAGESGSSEAAYSSPSPEEVRVNIPSGAAGWLVVSDSFASGWRASIDGEPAPIVAAFAAFRAVRVPAGAGEVVFRYEPREWRYAIFTSAGGGGAMLILLAWSIVRGRRTPEDLPYRVTR
jgi:hypothetical protein